jgi:hypothetical protein
VRSAGVIIDSVLAPGSELGPASIAIECDLTVPASLGPGAILHGACGVARAIEVPTSLELEGTPSKTTRVLTPPPGRAPLAP